MTTTPPTRAAKTMLSACFALLIALLLSLPGYAKDIELEPDALTRETPSAVAATADGDDSALSAEPRAAVLEGSADDGEGPEPPPAQTLTLAGLFDWLRSLLIFGG